jgi:hypothetical protein
MQSKEIAMRNFKMTLAGAVIAGLGLVGSAQAAPVGLLDGSRAAMGNPSIVEPAHIWGNQNYCWYEDGWNGAGWYQCGSVWQKGFGWGGPYGWHGWAAPMFGHRMGMYGHHMMGGCCW